MTISEFTERFLAVFAAGVPEKLIKKYVLSTKKYENYLWHLFSYKLLPRERYLSGDEARKAYDRADKKGAEYLVRDWSGAPERTEEVTYEQKSAAALDKYVEVYVVSKDFDWVYMKTHEHSLGPYFMKV